MPDNTPLPSDDPFSDFIQHDLDLDEPSTAADKEDWEEWEADGDPAMTRPFPSRPFVTMAVPPVLPRPHRRWWQARGDDWLLNGLLLLTALLILLMMWEQEQTVNGLNATIAAQQAQITDLQATLTTVQPR